LTAVSVGDDERTECREPHRIAVVRKATAVAILCGAAPWMLGEGGACGSIADAHYASLKLKAFRTITVTTDRKTGKVESKMTAEFVAPDFFHMVTERDGKTETQDMRIDPRSRSTVDQVVHDMSDCRRVGRDTVGLLPATVYQYTVNDKVAGKRSTKVWIADRDGLVHKQEFDWDSNRTVQLVEIDPAIKPHVR
jgi:hypothetical protein